MGNASFNKKCEQLGVNVSTANSKLIRMILFDLIVKLNLDTCFRCNEKITANTLSIEHKTAWLDNDPNLFWDLQNIAFSHRKCNYKAARKNPLRSPESNKKRSKSAMGIIRNPNGNNQYIKS